MEEEDWSEESVEADLMESVRLGYARITGKNAKGETLFELTELGKKRAEEIKAEHPDWKAQLGLPEDN